MAGWGVKHSTQCWEPLNCSLWCLPELDDRYIMLDTTGYHSTSKQKMAPVDAAVQDAASPISNLN